ncbi:phage replisome organizer N-terminal domain-containing protein, partial [Streptococcus pneumoniae]
MLGMSEIKWIKIKTDIFDDEKMCLIDASPDRDAI